MIDKTIDKLFKINESYDPYVIAKNHQINILELPLEDNQTCGLTITSNRRSSIILNDTINENLKEFVLCHELGHVFLHQTTSTPFMRNVGGVSKILKIEAEAHRFAFKLLHKQYEELNYMNKESIVNYFNLESWMERYID